MVKVINEDEIEEIKFSNVLVKELLVNEAPSITIAKIKLSGDNEKCKNTRSHIYYYILEGDGTFTIMARSFLLKKGIWFVFLRILYIGIAAIWLCCQLLFPNLIRIKLKLSNRC